MHTDRNSRLTMGGVCLVFLFLAVAFWMDLWGKPAVRPPVAAVDPVFPGTATVRLSARELIESGADTSGMDCMACHEPDKPLEVRYDAESNIVLPPAHQDLVYARMNCAACHRASEAREIQWDDDGNTIIPAAHRVPILRHGDNKRNNDCFNCHDKDDLTKLKLRDGKTLELTDSSLLCAGCHGPTYRDWEAGIHGRTNGHWQREAGPIDRKDCTSCHDPHFPAFPRMFPAPGPQTAWSESGAGAHPSEASHE